MERRIRQYAPRKRRLREAIEDNAARLGERKQKTKQRCAICTRIEDGGGLLCYKLRDGQELLVGDRCATYLDCLIADPKWARDVLK